MGPVVSVNIFFVSGKFLLIGLSVPIRKPTFSAGPEAGFATAEFIGIKLAFEFGMSTFVFSPIGELKLLLSKDAKLWTVFPIPKVVVPAVAIWFPGTLTVEAIFTFLLIGTTLLTTFFAGLL